MWLDLGVGKFIFICLLLLSFWQDLQSLDNKNKNKQGFIKVKNRMKMKATQFTNYVSENGLISKHVKNNNQKLEWREITRCACNRTKQIFFKKDTKMTKTKHKPQITHVWEMLISAAVSFLLILAEMCIIKKINKMWRRGTPSY